jgi:hypothetical protein
VIDHVFPLVSNIIQYIEEERPGQGLGNLESVLINAGINDSSQILLLPEDVLCIAADISQLQARILCNYTRCIVLSRLGLKGTYDEPELIFQTETEGKENSDKDGTEKGSGEEAG